MPELELLSYAIVGTEAHITVDDIRLKALDTTGIEKLITELHIVKVELEATTAPAKH